MRGFILGYMIAVVIILSGCTRTQSVVATESGTDIPYLSLGILEVKISADYFSAESLLWNSAELITFGFADTPDRADIYKKELREKLSRKAWRDYGAHEVINVEFWPDPSSKSFPEGYVYARGKMIKYKPFPESKVE